MGGETLKGQEKLQRDSRPAPAPSPEEKPTTHSILLRVAGNDRAYCLRYWDDHELKTIICKVLDCDSLHVWLMGQTEELVLAVRNIDSLRRWK